MNIYNFRILKIATHNINRLKANSYKLDILIDYAIEKNIDIIGINETNILEQQSKFLVNKESRYIGFWTGADRNKIKGSGVGFLISKEWEKYIGKVTRFSNYYIDMLLIFKKYKLVVISMYIPPSDKEEKKKIQHKVIQKIRECKRDRIWVIVISNFNDNRSKELNHSKEESNRKQALPLLRWLENSKLDDIFRKIYLSKKEYTFSNKISHTRIDYI